MKFNKDLDAQTFLLEIKEFTKLDEANKSYIPTDEEMKSFLKVRTPLVKKLKNYRKSANSKSMWRENRGKMMKGIKAFHKSVDGKRFHRRLGRFLTTRITRTKSNNESDNHFQMLLTKQGYLKGLNAAKQHLLVELEYFHQLQEQVELEEFIIEYAFPYFKTIEDKMITEEDLSDDEMIFLFDLIETNAIIKSFAEKTGQTFAQIEKVWNSISNALMKDGMKEDDEKFFPILVSQLKKSIGLK